MSTHNIGFYEDLTKIMLIIINYHQIRTLYLIIIVVRLHALYKHANAIYNQIVRFYSCKNRPFLRRFFLLLFKTYIVGIC